jgi:peptidoglycan-N-acetylglucosamine deacetylase
VHIHPKPITNVETQDSIAALTFDDGPHPVYTPLALSILEKHGAKATFFMIGEAASRYPEIVRTVARAGHAIGNHSWNHSNLGDIKSRFHRLKQMWMCARAVAPYCEHLLRPPYGGHNDQVKLDALIFGYKLVLWSESAQDWVHQGSEEIAQKIIDRVKPGTIFLLHDNLYRSPEKEADPSLPWDRKPMLQGLTSALNVLKKRIRFVTVPELLRSGQPISRWPRQTDS